MTGRRFVMLDRDGTINVEREYLGDPDGVTLLPGAAEGLRRMARAGLRFVILSNQSAIGRGYFTRRDAEAVNQRLVDLLRQEDVRIDGIYMCPHAPDDACRCRKPAPGLVEDAAREIGFDPHDSFMIGDKAIDMALGRRVGATTILVRTGYGAAQAADAAADADFTVDDLVAASAVIGRLLQSAGAPRQDEPA